MSNFQVVAVIIIALFFVMIVLIIDARRELIAREANAIGTAYRNR
jgi:hypothetical protein